jgi:hypothetical protein
MDLLSTSLLLLLTILLGFLATVEIGGSIWEILFFKACAITGAGFTAWGTVRWLLRSRDRRPRLEIHEHGLIDRTWVGQELRVPWDDVLSIEPTASSTLELSIRDSRDLNLGLHRRLVSRFLRRSRDTDAVVLVRGLDIPHEVVTAVAMARHSNHLIEGITAERGRLGPDGSNLAEARQGTPSEPHPTEGEETE